MQTFNVRETNTQLSKLVDQAAKGWSSQMKRCGFMAGQIVVPNDFDRMGETEIEKLFAADA